MFSSFIGACLDGLFVHHLKPWGDVTIPTDCLIYSLLFSLFFIEFMFYSQIYNCCSSVTYCIRAHIYSTLIPVINKITKAIVIHVIQKTFSSFIFENIKSLPHKWSTWIRNFIHTKTRVYSVLKTKIFKLPVKGFLPSKVTKGLLLANTFKDVLKVATISNTLSLGMISLSFLDTFFVNEIVDVTLNCLNLNETQILDELNISIENKEFEIIDEFSNGEEEVSKTDKQKNEITKNDPFRSILFNVLLGTALFGLGLTLAVY